jgi:septum formation protein
VDEDSARKSLTKEGAGSREIAESLAELKALGGASQEEELLIAADQVLVFNDKALGKAQNIEEATDRLRAFMGRKHELITAACVAKNGSVIWRHVDTARLWMRPLSDTFLECYVDRNRQAVLQTTGGYELEGGGAQLFSRIEGDYFSILGLPLIPILGVLREHGALRK